MFSRLVSYRYPIGVPLKQANRIMSNKKQQSLARFFGGITPPTGSNSTSPKKQQSLTRFLEVPQTIVVRKRQPLKLNRKEKLHHLNRHPVPRKLELKQSLMRVVVVVVMVISRWKQNQNWKK